MIFDTDNLDYSLSPLIASAMAQYIKALKEEGLPKYPNSFNDVYEWLHVLEEIHWAFDNYANQPDIGDYKFDIDWHEIGKTENGHKRMEIEIVGEDGHARYTKDLEDHEKRVQEGINLFSQYYSSLWL